jgi:hypothetical protein
MKPNYTYPFIALTLLFAPISSFALTINQIADQQSEQVLREQQQQLRLEERKRNLDELERSLIIIDTPLPQSKSIKELDSSVCFNIPKSN